jgi:OOP family OmpA-OmpF porin
MLRFKAQSAVTAILLAFAMSGPQAAENAGQAYVKGLATWVHADSDRRVDDEVAGGLVGFGYALNEHFNLEVDAQSLNLDGDGGTPPNPDQDQAALSINLLNIYNRGGTVAPYGLAGVGVVNTDVSGQRDQDDLQVLLGIGALTRLTERVSLRTEVLYRWQDASSSLDDVLVNAGFSVALGGAAQAAPVAASAPAPAAPPPVPAAAAEPPPPPADGDRDGVADGNDQCPGTPQGVRVDAKGCECDVTRRVFFKSDSAELTDEGRQVLRDVAASAKRLGWVIGAVEGHTDSEGSEQYNQALSMRRARAAIDFLVGEGISGERLQAVGMGEGKPRADNGTAEGRAENRRVVLRRTDCG